MDERWIPVPGYEGFYEVSDLGRLRSLRCGMGIRSRPRIVRGMVERNGYRRWRLTTPETGRHGKRYLSHRLVLSAFRGEPPADHECAHVDGTRLNNVLPNLQWVAHAENIRQRDEHGTTAWGERDGQAKLTREDVHNIRRRYAAGGISHAALAREHGVCTATVSHILNGRNWRRLGAA